MSDPRLSLAVRLAGIACEAGAVILASARTPRFKPDGSPVTEADRDAQGVICDRLADVLPGVAVLAEETFEAKAARPMPAQFVLVDPLDGTREFVAGRGEYTVNIALIEAGVPVAGCIYAPALGRLYVGAEAAYAADVAPGAAVAPESLRPIRTRPYRPEGLHALVSRSHLDAHTETLLGTLPVASREAIGSSLKFCLIAEGKADVYVRCGPTMEWDIGAGHAVLTAAGGRVLSRDGAPMTYGKFAAGYRNDGFVAWGREALGH